MGDEVIVPWGLQERIATVVESRDSEPGLRVVVAVPLHDEDGGTVDTVWPTRSLDDLRPARAAS